MTINTMVPKLGETHAYLGKPVKDEKGNRIGSITDVKELDDNYMLTMTIDDKYNNAIMGNMEMSCTIDTKSENLVAGPKEFADLLVKENMFSHDDVDNMVYQLAAYGLLETAAIRYNQFGVNGLMDYCHEIELAAMHTKNWGGHK